MAKIPFEHPTLLLVEHGETEFSERPGHEDRIHGTKFDLPLIALGRQQAKKDGEKLNKYDIATLEHSPQLRSTQHAKIISDIIGVPAKKDDRLRPLDTGIMSGMTHEKAENWLRYYIENPHKKIPGSVSGQGIYDKWYDGWSEALAEGLKLAEKTPGQGHVKVLHSSEIMTVRSVIQGDPPTVASRESLPASGEILMLEKRGGKWRMKAFEG